MPKASGVKLYAKAIEQRYGLTPGSGVGYVAETIPTINNSLASGGILFTLFGVVQERAFIGWEQQTPVSKTKRPKKSLSDRDLRIIAHRVQNGSEVAVVHCGSKTGQAQSTFQLFRPRFHTLKGKVTSSGRT